MWGQRFRISEAISLKTDSISAVEGPHTPTESGLTGIPITKYALPYDSVLAEVVQEGEELLDSLVGELVDALMLSPVVVPEAPFHVHAFVSCPSPKSNRWQNCAKSNQRSNKCNQSWKLLSSGFFLQASTSTGSRDNHRG